MSRSGKPPQPVPGGMCRCGDGERALADGLFCSDHELLWIAHAGCTSNKLGRKHKKLWALFIEQYRVKWFELYNIREGGRKLTATEIKMRYQVYQAQSRIWPPRGGKAYHVHTATLPSLGKDLAGSAQGDNEGD